MSNQIKPVLVSDPLLMLEDSVNFAVYRGGQNVSVQKFPATSATNTAHQYQIQVPSLSTVVDRAIIWGSDITFTLTGTPTDADTFLVNYGYTDVPAPFPLNNLCTNMNIQINNTSVSLPVNQVLDPILRSIDSESIALWQGSTPTQLDYWGDYNNIDAIYEEATANSNNSSPFNGYSASFNRREPPRGAYPVSIAGNTAQAAEAVLKTVTVTISVREPLFVSPFIYESPEGHSGMSGVTQINITAQMDALAKRAYRYFVATKSPCPDKQITSVSYANSYLECKFLTAKPSDLIPSTIITPMYNLQNYITPPSAKILSEANGWSTTLTSNSIQINSIPDKVFVFVRQPQAVLNPTIADVYLSITNIKVTFGNQSGICSNFTVEDLHRASLLAGSKQTYLDFIGYAQDNGRSPTVNADTDRISTCGSVLCLNFGESINIPEDYFAPGSLSTTQFQITLDVTWNGDREDGFTVQPELNCMFMTSGVFSCNNGSSASYTSGVLSKQVVLDANSSEPVNKAELSRLVGGGFMSSLKTIAHNLMPKLHRVVKHHGQNAANALLHEAVSAVGLAPAKRHRLKRM